jgi:hypothetical protein
MMKRLVPLTCVFAILVACGAEAQTKGLGPNLLGMSMQAVRSNMPSLNCNAFGSAPPPNEKWCSASFYVPRMPEARALVEFENDKAVSYRVWYPAGTYVQLRRILDKRLGAPKETRTKTFWTDAGQKFDSEEVTWSGADAVVTSQQFAPYGDGVRTSIIIETPSRHEYAKGREQSDDDKIAKGLLGD